MPIDSFDPTMQIHNIDYETKTITLSTIASLKARGIKEIQMEMVYECQGCHRQFGPTIPNLASCPGCHIRFSAAPPKLV